jgi:hypothetical protein
VDLLAYDCLPNISARQNGKWRHLRLAMFGSTLVDLSVLRNAFWAAEAMGMLSIAWRS